MASGKGQFYFYSDSKSEEREVMENVSLENSSQICEETRRIQDPVQFTGRKTRPQRQLTALESDPQRRTTFPPIIIPIAITDNHCETNLLAN